MRTVSILVMLMCGLARGEESRLESAKSAYWKGDLKLAIETLEPLLAGDPSADGDVAEARVLAAKAYHRRGEDHFRRGRVDESIRDFDREIELSPDTEPEHWQRGLSHYYAGEYAKGVKQFELHQTVNPQDVENAVWHFLCAVRAPGGSVEAARKNLIPITSDTRVPMMRVHELFAGRSTPEEVMKAAAGAGPVARFYADLYVGLYLEAIGKDDESLKRIRDAAESPAAENNYMGDVAKIHIKVRTERKKLKPKDESTADTGSRQHKD